MAGQDARGVRVDFGVPGQRAAESGLHTEVEAAVPGAERADQRRAHDVGGHVTGSVGPRPQEPLLSERPEAVPGQKGQPRTG